MKVRFTVTYEVETNLSKQKEIGEMLANVNIPENDECKYVQDTFEPDLDENGNIEIY